MSRHKPCHMTNKRTAKAVRLGRSLAVILPVDWVRGHELQKGDLLTVEYNGHVSVSAPLKRDEAEPDG